eukprot:TRINITY_DN37252_c0_g1_i1.p1 TRINITY_DN37252_c0_g1~~TRINITY_DN37252_c0_g1_i1.p1  ORF type:complete len:134 (-),score=37.67 TRINITY_DN37252_c0_g1_i1:250-651(-)
MGWGGCKGKGDAKGWNGGGKSWGGKGWGQSWAPVMSSWGKGFGKGEKGKGQKRQFPADQKVWLGGIPADTTKQELYQFLKENTDTKWVHISAKDATTGWAGYASKDAANNAIGVANGSVFKGSVLQLDSWQKE